MTPIPQTPPDWVADAIGLVGEGEAVVVVFNASRSQAQCIFPWKMTDCADLGIGRISVILT